MACVRKRRVGKGSRWVLDYRDQQGRRHWETTKGNRKEAEGRLAERVRQIGRGTYRAPAERVSFEDLGEAYLKGAAANVRATTLKDYTCNLTLHLMPYFRGWKIRDIRRADVEAFRAHLLEAGIGPTTVNKCLTLLGACSATPSGTSTWRRTPRKAPSSAAVRAVATISSRRTS